MQALRLMLKLGFETVFYIKFVSMFVCCCLLKRPVTRILVKFVSSDGYEMVELPLVVLRLSWEVGERKKINVHFLDNLTLSLFCSVWCLLPSGDKLAQSQIGCWWRTPVVICQFKRNCTAEKPKKGEIKYHCVGKKLWRRYQN